MTYPVLAVVAMARNRVIGDGEKLLWHLPGDLPRVKALTMGKPLIMGRKTFSSIGRPLAGRANIVLTRQADWRHEGVLVARTVDEALVMANQWIDEDKTRIGEVIVFGGGIIYELLLGQCDAIDLTEVDLNPEGGAVFPELKPNDWVEVSRDARPQDGNTPAHAFVRYHRNR